MKKVILGMLLLSSLAFGEKRVSVRSNPLGQTSTTVTEDGHILGMYTKTNTGGKDIIYTTQPIYENIFIDEVITNRQIKDKKNWSYGFVPTDTSVLISITSKDKKENYMVFIPIDANYDGEFDGFGDFNRRFNEVKRISNLNK